MNLTKARISSSSLILLGIAVSLGASRAETVTLNAVNSGYYNVYGVNNGTAGNIAMYGDTVRDWLGFNLTGLNGVVTGGTLVVSSHSSNASGQTIKWWDVTTPYADLGVVGKPNGASIFNDIGSGVLLAQGTHTAGQLNSFDLNPFAIASLNSANSFWAIGGQNTGGANYAFGYQNGVAPNSGVTVKLVLNVEPGNRVGVPEAGSSLAMLAAGLGGLITWRARRKA